MFGCDVFDGPCCISCHEDEAEFGMYMSDVDEPGQPWDAPPFAHVCCVKIDQARLKAEGISRSPQELSEPCDLFLDTGMCSCPTKHRDCCRSARQHREHLSRSPQEDKA